MRTRIALVVVCAVALAAAALGWQQVSNPPTSGSVAAGLGFTPLNPANNLSELGSSVTARTNLGMVRTFVATADFTTAANTNLQTITGLTWTLPANVAQNVPFECHLAYSQATAAVADSFGVQASVAPTNIFATGAMNTDATTRTWGNLPALSSTTATAIVTATPSAITTVWNADLSGWVENPSQAASTISVSVKTATAADVVTVKRGSFCIVQ